MPIKGEQAPVSQAHTNRTLANSFPNCIVPGKKELWSQITGNASLNGGSDFFTALLSACAIETPVVCRQVFQMYLEFRKYCTTSGFLQSLRMKHVDGVKDLCL